MAWMRKAQVRVSEKMTHKTFILPALLAAVFVLNGCTSTDNNVFGEDKPAPDEFAVYSRAPLSLPPDFGLRPPKPGANRPQTLQPRNQARDALLSGAGKAPGNGGQATAQGDAAQSPGIQALLSSAGADQAAPDIRFLVNSETAALSGGTDENLADSILFWRQRTGLRGAIIDPAVEERRMRRKDAEGNVIIEPPAPTIVREGGGVSRTEEGTGFWGSLFD